MCRKKSIEGVAYRALSIAFIRSEGFLEGASHLLYIKWLDQPINNADVRQGWVLEVNRVSSHDHHFDSRPFLGEPLIECRSIHHGHDPIAEHQGDTIRVL